MKSVITLARQHGSGGAEIARRVAVRLDWKLLDRQILDEVARLARVPPEEAEAYDERVNPWVVRLAKGLWSGSADSFASAPGSGVLDADLMTALTRQVVLDVATEGRCVILGRGAQCILGEREDALRVLVYAPFSDRLRRIRARYPSESSASAAIARIDRARSAYVQHYYGCDRMDPEGYDLLVNSRLGLETAVELVLCASGHHEAIR